MKFINLTTIFLLLLLTTSCKMMYSRGHYIEDESIAKMRESIEQKSYTLTQQQVIELIGTPTLEVNYDKNKWYYMYQFMSKRAWFDPKVEKQRVVMLQFSNHKNLQDIAVYDNLQDENVKVISDYTKVYGTEETPIQSFVKNVGRFRPKTVDYNKRNRGKKNATK